MPVVWCVGAAVAAVVEVVLRTIGDGVSFDYVFLMLLLAVAGTLVAMLQVAPAVVILAVADLLSLFVLHMLTVAAVATLFFVLFRVGALWTYLLAMPFVMVGIAWPSPMGTLVAAGASAASWAGVAVRADKETRMHRAARQAVATTLVEHTARGERARIARELHDVVAHHISMIAVQAETARLTTPRLDPLGAQRFSEIGDRARKGLTEMRRLLGVLREDTEGGVDLQPQPGLDQLVDLLDDARLSAGARLIVSGAPVPLDPGVELAAYRIVQEALTNARRHAPGAAVDVELYYGKELRVRIRDNGPGPGNSAGHGLTGMRERAAAVGGTLRIGTTAVGGFLVEATLPVEAT